MGRLLRVATLTLAAILAGVAAPVTAQQVLGRRDLPDDLARKYWDEVLIRCGDRVFTAENYGLFVRVTEYRGNVSLKANEFVLDKAWLAANRIEAKGTLLIRFTESRCCRFSKDHPENNSAWSEWVKPINGIGTAFPFTKAGGKLVVSAGVVVMVACDAIAAMDAFCRKESTVPPGRRRVLFKGELLSPPDRPPAFRPASLSSHLVVRASLAPAGRSSSSRFALACRSSDPSTC